MRGCNYTGKLQVCAILNHCLVGMCSTNIAFFDFVWILLLLSFEYTMIAIAAIGWLSCCGISILHHKHAQTFDHFLMRFWEFDIVGM